MNQQQLQQKMKDWQLESESYLNEMKDLIQMLDTAKQLIVICYFTSSFQLSHQADRVNYGIGSFHIQNLGTQPLMNPHIGIKITSNIDFNFSGKYLYPSSKKTVRVSNAWERINESTDKKEIWLKPTQKESIDPGEILTFSNFQLKWEPDASYSGTIQGFTYGNELPDGIHALNQINLNGTITDRQEEGQLDEKK
ncbi:hypothetical protein [Gracilibacillus kekensis]|uniref:Uncharacterized protein n=1 Tax=Gracilibacillus kekensis TaxID=1027249 RepID=A0A1M7NST9_9BACI|nr:hypothetical protein [Gracilibacillus kekensis]SHN07137.1 hypothetical protein SAMN05216179_1744 [Gracilibacillus kekensis]